jgi:hypothetical protein
MINTVASLQEIAKGLKKQLADADDEKKVKLSLTKEEAEKLLNFIDSKMVVSVHSLPSLSPPD